MAPRVLITGGLGFMGSHLADRYQSQGWQVIALDNLTGNVVDVDHPSIDTFLIADARQVQPGHVASVDLVVHAASPVGGAGILSEQGTIAGNIVASTQAVVDACVVAGVPLINVSTSEVYGTPGVAAEDFPLIVPPSYSARLEYQTGKIAAEQVVGASIARGLRAIQIRPWNMVGPREAHSKGFVLPRLIQQALDGEYLTIFEGGEQERAFTGVWDVCRFITDHLPPHDEWLGQPYNVGAEHNQTTIRNLAGVVLEFCNSRSAILHTSGKAVFGERYEEAAAGTKLPDARLARRCGWYAEFSLRSIVSRTVSEIVRERAL